MVEAEESPAAPTTDAKPNPGAKPETKLGRKATWIRRLKRTGFAWLVGMSFWLSVPDTELWWLGFVMWVPWIWMLDGLRPKAALFYGFVSGVSAISVGFFWITELLTRFAFPEFNYDGSEAFGFWSMPLSLVGHLLFSIWQGAQWGFSAWLFTWMRRRTPVSPLWLMPISWVVVEAFLPNLFPTYMALSWCFEPLWTQVAELGGVSSVTFVMCSINAALYVVLRHWWDHREWSRRSLIVLAAWLIGTPTYGAIRMAMIDARIEAAPSLKIGVVQGNFGIETFRTHRREILKQLQKKTAELESEGAEVGLWGETAYPYPAFARTSTKDARTGRLRVRRGFTIPLVFGLVTRESHRNVNPYPWNSAVVLNPDGTLGDRYDKVYPLLFGEAAPSFIDPAWYTSVIPNASHLNRGEGPGVLRLDQWRLGPLICYEDILPRFVRGTAQQEVHAFVNLTNDSWFGNTREQPEHLGLAVYRAIEHRKSLLRSVNAGVSVYVDPAGRVIHQTEVTDSDHDGYKGADGFVADVAMLDPGSLTVYGYTGETFNVTLLLILIGLAWHYRKRDSKLAARP